MYCRVKLLSVGEKEAQKNDNITFAIVKRENRDNKHKQELLRALIIAVTNSQIHPHALIDTEKKSKNFPPTHM